MSVLTTFSPIAPRPDATCGVCLDQLEKDVVAHLNGDGLKHPFHQACIDIWLRVQSYCPACHKDVILRFTRFDWTAYAVTAIVLSNAIPAISAVVHLGVKNILSIPVIMGIEVINLLFLYLIYQKLETRPENWKRLPVIRAITEPSIAAYFLVPLSVIPGAIISRPDKL